MYLPGVEYFVDIRNIVLPYFIKFSNSEIFGTLHPIPKPTGDNYVKGLLTLLRTFFIWANKTGKTNKNPFKERQIKECVYGTPIFITDEERKKIYETNLSFDKRLEEQRDIFIFQCMIGCRISDLYSMRQLDIPLHSIPLFRCIVYHHSSPYWTT